MPTAALRVRDTEFVIFCFWRGLCTPWQKGLYWCVNGVPYAILSLWTFVLVFKDFVCAQRHKRLYWYSHDVPYTTLSLWIFVLGKRPVYSAPIRSVLNVSTEFGTRYWNCKFSFLFGEVLSAQRPDLSWYQLLPYATLSLWTFVFGDVLCIPHSTTKRFVLMCQRSSHAILSLWTFVFCF